MTTVRDRDIRATLRRELWTAHPGPDARLIDELGICQGNARIDVALVNGALNGFEIKSEADTLERLATQAAIYSRVLDTVVIVASSCHVDAIADAVPDWWGIMDVRGCVPLLQLNEVRGAERNPGVDGSLLVQLLWRDEALAALAERGLTQGFVSKPRREIWARVADALTLE